MFYLGVVLQAVCGCFDLYILHSVYKVNARVRFTRALTLYVECDYYLTSSNSAS